MAKSMVFQVATRVLVSVQSKDDTTDAEWDAYIAYAMKHLSSIDAIFVYSDGGMPNAQQRDRLAKAWAERGTRRPVVMLCPSVFARVVIRAIDLVMGGQSQVFNLDQVDRAMKALALTSSQQSAVRESLVSLQREVDAAR